MAGGLGLLGTELASAFKKDGNEVRLLGRSFKGREAEGLGHHLGSCNGEMDAGSAEGCYHLINLAGESVAGKLWTDARKDQILGSRVYSVCLLADTISVSGYRPQKIIQASAVGIYGAKTGSDIFTIYKVPGLRLFGQCLYRLGKRSKKVSLRETEYTPLYCAYRRSVGQ